MMHGYKYTFVFSFFFVIILNGACKNDPHFVLKYKPAELETLKIQKPELKYDSVYPEFVYENLHMPGVVKRSGVYGQRKYGMIVRTLRFENIAKAVEQKYGLPDNLLLAMIMQESGGADLLPNSSDDGGLGLIHMQPSVAREFGLKTYQDCNKLVSKPHGKALRKLIKKYNYDKKQLIAFDDRFHPILNMDAAGRMLAYHAGGKQYKDTPFKTAIFRYAGATNYKKYLDNVLLFMGQLEDKKLLKDVENVFNDMNPNLKIDEKKADFKAYIKSHKKQNINYGLREYESK